MKTIFPLTIQHQFTPIPKEKNQFCSIVTMHTEMKNCTIGHFMNIAQVLFNCEKKKSKCISTIEPELQTGRQSNVSFPFLKQHPLYETFQDHLRSKTVIPILIGLPEIEAKFSDAKLSEAWPQRVKIKI